MSASTAARMPSSEEAKPETTSRLDVATASGQRGQGTPSDKGIAAPALAAFDGFKEEAVAFTDHVGEGRHWGKRVGHDLTPHRHDGVRFGQCGELGRVWSKMQHQSGRGTPGPFPTVRKKQVRSPV